MKTVLYVDAQGPQLWARSASGWQRTDRASGPVWVVTDLAEESFSELPVPRIFGRDRSDFVQRQLASRFADTPYRCALPTGAAWARLAQLGSPQQTLVGIDAAARIDEALNALAAPVVGVWCTSLLLAQLAQRRDLPTDLFVVVATPARLRIVFLRDRVPLLTRLVAVGESGADAVAEIVRTLRHLENTRVVERDQQRHGVLLLGEGRALRESLAAQRLDLLEMPARWRQQAMADWRWPVFERVLQSPAGQLAPLARRSAYLAQRLRRVAYLTSALAVLVSLWDGNAHLQSAQAARAAQSQARTELRQVTENLAQAEQTVQHWGVAASQVRLALAWEQQELGAAPSFSEALLRIAKIIAQQPDLRASGVHWRVLGAAQAACSPTGAAPTGTSEPGPAAASTQPAALPVELQLDLQLAEGSGARERARSVAQVSRALLAIPGVRLLEDPADSLAQATLDNHDALGPGATRHWCLRWQATTAPETLP